MVATPDIKVFQITKQHDFVVLACDGIFDKMSDEDVSSCVWNSCNLEQKDKRPAQNVHQQCGLAVESVLKNSLYRQSLDNVTVVMIAFQSFKRTVFGRSKHSERSPGKQGQAAGGNNHSSSISDIHQNDSQKENINANKNRAGSASLSSFL